MKDTTVRFYWIAWDGRYGDEGEEVRRTLHEALKVYNALGDVPYKKLVACYNDRDEDLYVAKAPYPA